MPTRQQKIDKKVIHVLGYVTKHWKQLSACEDNRLLYRLMH